jgi:hypothetical protein
MKINQFTLIITLLITNQSIAQKDSDTFGTFKFDVSSTKSTSVFKHKNTGLVYFKADYDLDFDGSPRAYNPTNTGIEENGNAQNSAGAFSESIILFKNKKPYLQKANNPFPGFFISLTSLKLQNFPDTSVKRYVDSEKIPYFVLPGNKLQNAGIELGDIGLIFNTETNKSAFAIFADSGPTSIVGEGSLALAKALEIKLKTNSRGKIVGGIDDANILYIAFPKSGKGANKYQNLTVLDVETLGNKAIKQFGDKEKVIKMILDLMK